MTRKFKLKTLAKTFEEFGRDLGYNVNEGKRISFIDISYTRTMNIAKVIDMKSDPLKSIEKV